MEDLSTIPVLGTDVLLPVLVEDGVGWLGSVLQRLLVHSLGFFVHPPLLKLLRPGRVEGGRPRAHAITVEVSVQRDGVRIITRLQETAREQLCVILVKTTTGCTTITESHSILIRLTHLMQ